MLQEALIYLELGIEHLLDLEGYDHMLFLVALCAGYSYRDWRKLLWLVTAFTIGHSITLALAVFYLSVSASLIEWLIPVTIVLAALYELTSATSSMRVRYGMALIFGLVHGLGFSNFLKAMFSDSGDVLLPLLSFNVGLEVAQGVFVLLLLFVGWVLTDVLGLASQRWSRSLAVIAMVVAGYMVIERFPFL